MKPYLKSFLLIAFGLPLLAGCLMIAAALLNGDLFMDLSSPEHCRFYANLLLLLWLYACLRWPRIFAGSMAEASARLARSGRIYCVRVCLGNIVYRIG